MSVKVGLLAGLIVILVMLAGLVFRLANNDDCFMYGDSYTKIKDVQVAGDTYHLYLSQAGSHDKSTLISLSQGELPEMVCDYSKIKDTLHSTDIDPERKLVRLLITRQADGRFVLDPVYAPARSGEPAQDFTDFEVELKGVEGE